jgi:ketosteroid isomerase-like protein
MESQTSTDSGSSSFEQRLRRLEDIEEIKKLKARYCEACDGGWDGRASHDYEKIVALFAEDGVWEGGVYGRREGRDAIREYYQHNPEVPFAFHLLTNPIIEVDGDHATGRWHLLISLTQADRTAVLVGGVFDDQYVRTAQGWRIGRSQFSLALHTPYSGTWSAQVR